MARTADSVERQKGDFPAPGSTTENYRPLKKHHLKWAVLAPYTVISILATFLYINNTFWERQQDLEFEGSRISDSVEQLYQKGLVDHTEILSVATDSIIQNSDIAEALKRGDRQQLLAKSENMYAILNARYGVSHWYYTGVDRVNILRMHQPGRFGDIIGRQTMLQAQRTGQPASGIEIGPLGTFTLRYVRPWYERQNGMSTLIGYVELGLEVEHFFDEIEAVLGVEMEVFLEKKVLNRKLWEEGVKSMGHESDWDRYQNVVSSAVRKGRVSRSLISQLAEPGETVVFEPVELEQERKEFRMTPVPLQDVSDNHVGYAAVFVDVSAKHDASNFQVAFVSLIAITACGLIFIFFYHLLDATEIRLSRSEQQLREMATKDGLTGLLNHRTLQENLREEVERARRYDRPLTMLMVDADLFKQVNDNYGHQVGDLVLKRLARLLEEECREIDTLYRYGGEELSVLLPETSLPNGMLVAERIRKRIEKDTFASTGVRDIKVTVSIGVSEFPSSASSFQELAERADQALYQAKEQGRNRVVSATV